MKWLLTFVSVTVASGAATGASAANPAIAGNASKVIGLFPTGVATSTGWGLVETVVLGSNGAVTVTTRANVATADLTVTVVVATPFNG